LSSSTPLEHVEDDMPNAAGDLFVDAGIAASDVICCVRLGVHSSSGTHSEAVTLLERRRRDPKST
jgi:hypothetical protein